SDHRQRGQIMRMAVALNYLRRNCGSLQAQPRTHLLLEFWGKVRENADRSREFSDPHIFGGSRESCNIALRFRIPVGNLESQGNRLGMDAMRPTDHWRIFEFPCSPLKNIG